MRILIGFITVIALLVVGLLVAPSFIDWSKYKEQGQQQIKTMTGYDVVIGGDFAFAFLPAPHVNAKNVQVINSSVSSDPLASFDELSVSVELAPLLQKQVQVSEIKLVKPSFDVRIDSEGKGNWLSPEIEAMMQKKEGEVQGASSKPAAAISFDEISIEDGSFRFADASKGSVSEVSDVNLDVNAKSLSGPFEATGDAVFNGQKLTFDGKAGEIDKTAQSVTLNLKASQGPYDVDYKGVIAFAKPYEAQGEVALGAKSLPGLGDAIALNGFVTANEQGASFKNVALEIGEHSLAGELAVGLKPMSVKANFTGADVLDLDVLLPKKQSAQGGDDIAGLVDILPKTITLPQDFTADVALSVPGVVYNKALSKDVSLRAVKSGKDFFGQAQIGQLPGNGPAVIKGDLKFGDVSTSKSGAQVCSDPTLTVSVQANSQNTAQLVQAFTGQSSLPIVSQSKIGKFQVNAQAVPGRISVSEAIVNLDDLKASLAGSLKRGEGGRALLTAKVQADAFNFDRLGGDKPKGAAPTDALQALALPFDVDFDVAVNQATMNGQGIQGLQATGSVRPDQLTIKKAAASDFGGAAFDIAGSIGSLKALSGLDFTINASASDPYKVAKTFKVDSASWPKNLGAVAVNAKAKGTLVQLDTQTNVKAFGANFIVQGNVQNPMTALTFSDLAVQIKHDNMATFLKNIGASVPEYASFEKPLDFYTKIDTDGKITSLSGIQATLAGTNMTGALKYDASAAKPVASGDLKFGRLELVSKNSKARSSGGGGGSSAGGERWPSAKINTGFLHAMNATFNVAADSILYEKWDMKSPSLTMSLLDGKLDITDLQAGLFDGQIAVKGQLASASPDAPLSLNTNTSITNVNLGALTYALSGSRRIQADGDASLTLNIAGNGASSKAIVNSLNGNAKLSGTNIVMKGFDLAGLASALLDSNKPMERIEQLVGASSSGGETAFDTVQGAYTINKGIASIDSMAMTGPEAIIKSTGHVDIPQWTINTKHNIALQNAPGVEPFDVTIKGPLDNPGNTFGKGLFKTYYQQKLIEKVPDLLGDDVSEKLQKFGILPQAQQAPKKEPANDSEPAAGDDIQTQQQSAPKTREEQRQEAIRGVLKGLLQ